MLTFSRFEFFTIAFKMSSKIIDTVAILTATLLLIFSTFAFSYKKGKIISHKILAVFLFANALYIIDFALIPVERVTGLNLRWFSGIGSSFGFLFGPLLYLYSKSITQKDFSLKNSQLIHIVIFAFAFFRALFKINIPFIYWYSIFHFQTVFYMIACFVVIINYRKEIRNYYSSVEKLNLSWMLYVVGAFFIMWMVDLSSFVFADLNFLGPAGESYLTFVSLMINFVFAILIFYKAIQHPEIFTGIDEEEKRQKYEQSRLTEAEKKEYLQKLEDYFISEKPYLKSELTISEVAKNLDVSAKYLSQVINESLGKNFYDFINSYRIDEAKKQLNKTNDSKKTVLEVLYESGFNSKSAFNNAFKRQTGYTPTQYRKQATID